MKKCRKCGEEKLLEAFSRRYKNQETRLNHCKDCCAIRNKKWINNNIEYVKDKQREYQKQKRQDTFYKTKMNLRSSIANAFNERMGFSRNSKISKILGCSYEKAYTHLISTALKNYGIWCAYESYHIDHIVPISIASSEEELEALSHYTNLQLLYPEDNLKKSNKILT